MPEIPHTLEGVRLGQHFANYFVDTARYSSHKPESPEQELQMLIYSTPPVFSARFESVAEDNYGEGGRSLGVCAMGAAPWSCWCLMQSRVKALGVFPRLPHPA
jgi:hypothetical protein